MFRIVFTIVRIIMVPIFFLPRTATFRVLFPVGRKPHFPPILAHVGTALFRVLIAHTALYAYLRIKELLKANRQGGVITGTDILVIAYGAVYELCELLFLYRIPGIERIIDARRWQDLIVQQIKAHQIIYPRPVDKNSVERPRIGIPKSRIAACTSR